MTTRKLSPRQRYVAYLELCSVRSYCHHGKAHTYKVAVQQCAKRAVEAAFAGVSTTDIDDLCKITDYFSARAYPGARRGDFQFNH